MEKKLAKLRRLKLLFIEDEKDLLEIISDTLVKLDVNFLTASNGKEALEICEENKDISIIVTDLNMPIMNGLEFIRKLKEKNIDIPIIIMSAHTETDYINKAKDLGVDKYLLKPFDFIKFIDLITQLDNGFEE